MQPTNYDQALDDWLEGRFEVPRKKVSPPDGDEFFEVDAAVTHHAAARAAQRSIAAELLPLLTVSGSIRSAGEGCNLVYISSQEAHAVGCARLANLAAIVSAEGVVVTTYRLTRPPQEWDHRYQRRRVRRQRAFFSREVRRNLGYVA